MQIREQGRKVQCIRATYNPATKRSDQKVIASFDRHLDSMPSDDLIENLSDQERAQLEQWMAEKQKKAAASRMDFALLYAGDRIQVLADAVTQADSISSEKAGEIWTALRALEKALRKSGHPRPVRPKKPAPASPLQADLLDSAG